MNWEDECYLLSKNKFRENANIINIELTKRANEYLTFLFDIQIQDLKDFTNLISQLKQEKLIHTHNSLQHKNSFYF